LKDRGMTDKDGLTFKAGEGWYSMEIDYKNMQFAYTAKLDKIKYGVNIYKYDADMKEVKKVSLRGNRELGPFSPQMLYFQNRLVVLYYKVMEDNSIKLYMSVVDPATLEEKENNDLYAISERNVGLFKIEGVLNRNRLALKISPDSSKLLISQSGNTGEMFTCIVGPDLVPMKKMTTRIREKMEEFEIQNCAIDNAGNKYFGYSYKAGPANKKGMLLQDNNGKETYLPLTPGRNSGFEADQLSFQSSRDNTRMYVYTTYGHSETEEEGVLLTTVDVNHAVLAEPQLFPFPMDLRMKLSVRDYTNKEKGGMTVKQGSYHMTEMDNGTVVLSGSPVNLVARTMMVSSMNHSTARSVDSRQYFHGPVIHVFINNGICVFGVLNRNQQSTQASGFIVQPLGDKLVCIYTDTKKNMESLAPDELSKPADADNLVLGEAVFGSDGALISRKVIGDRMGNLNYFTSYSRPLSDHSYIFPLGRNRVNMVRYYTEVEQWAVVDINR